MVGYKKNNKEGKLEVTDQFGNIAEDYSKEGHFIGGKDVSKEVYQESKRSIGTDPGKIANPVVKEVIQNQQAIDAALVAKRGVSLAGGTAQTTAQNLTPTTKANIVSQGKPGLQTLQTQAENQAAQDTYTGTLNESLNQEVAKPRSNLFNVAGAALLAEAKGTFEAYDNFRALLTGGDTTRVKDAREIFTKSSTAFENDIKRVSTGELSAADTLKNLKDAMVANEKIARQVKTKGLTNLRYWLRDGKDIQVEARLNRDELNRLYGELLIAVENGKAAQSQQALIQKGEVLMGGAK